MKRFDEFYVITHFGLNRDLMMKKFIAPLMLVGSFFASHAYAEGADALNAKMALAPVVPAHHMVNVGDAKRAAIAYYENGTYQKDFDEVMKQAHDYLLKTAPKVEKPAIVLDIDETTLSNWAEIKANDFGYVMDGSCDSLPKGPCGDRAWIKRAEAPIFASTRDLIKDAQAHHVAVFFITGRSAKYQPEMVQNLTKVGLSNWAGLYMRPEDNHLKAAAYKTPLRAKIEAQGYHIIESIGDQPNDVQGGHLMRGFILPNPFYSVQ